MSAAGEMFEKYQKVTGDNDPIPLMALQGNEILEKKFHDDVCEVYEYCIEHKVTWAEVLDFKEITDPYECY